MLPLVRVVPCGRGVFSFTSPGFVLAPAQHKASLMSHKEVGWEPLLRFQVGGNKRYSPRGQVGGRVGWPHPQHHRPRSDFSFDVVAVLSSSGLVSAGLAEVLQ